MRKTATAACVGAVLALCTACGSSGPSDPETAIVLKSEGKISVAVVPRLIGPEYWTLAERGARCAAQRDKDTELRWTGVSQPNDGPGQVQALEKELAHKPIDALVYAAADPASTNSITKRALKSGVAVSNFDTGSDPQPDDVPLFNTDDFAAARDAAKFLAAKPPPPGDPAPQRIGVLEFQPGGPTNDQRVAGFLAELDSKPGYQVVARASSDGDVAKATSAAEEMLHAQPELRGIFAPNEASALGAAEAIRRAGKVGQISIVGWDSGPASVQAMRDGVVDALVVQNPFRMAYDAVRAVIMRIRHGESLSSVDTGSMLVTKEGMDSPESAAMLNPTCENPAPGVEKN